MSNHYCDTPTCPVYTYTTGRVRYLRADGLQIRNLPVCPVCGDIGDSLDENGNPYEVKGV